MSDKIGELILNVKELIQEGTRSTEDCIKDIDNQIDSKQNEIRQMFADNIDSVISHYLKYHETLFYHKRLQADCEEFSKHIEKAQKLNAYDEQQIEKSEKTLQMMKGIKFKLSSYRNYIKLARKAVVNIKEEKYNNAIKIICDYKKQELKLDTPLKKVLPILQRKVEEHLKKLFESFWVENKKKMFEIGRNCFQRMSSNLQEKMNIYQIFFGDNMNRSSLMNKSSINAFRCTVLEKENSSRIMKSSEDTEQYFNKVMIRVNVEMSTLKKVKVMVVELKSQSAFNQMLKASIQDYLVSIEQSHCCSKQQQFVNTLSELIGLMLIKRQVCAYFDLKLDERVFLSQMYIFIGRQIKSLTFIVKNIEIVVHLKQQFIIFHRILNILKLNESNENYNGIVAAMLKTYSQRNLQTFESLSMKQIASDNMTHFKTQDVEKDGLVRQMLDMGSQQFKCTSYVIFVLDYFLNTYNQITQLIEESDINHSVILQALKSLYQRVLKIYGSEVLSKDMHYQIIQGEVNAIHINKIYKYMLRQLSIYHGVVVNNTLEDKFEQLVVKLTRNILEVIRQKLTKLMEDYSAMNPNILNDSYNDFVEWALEFVYHIIVFMKDINCPNYQSITIQSMREMCELYWQYLKGLKQINLVIIYNLDLDLSFIYKYCSKNFAGNISILDKFKSLREFYALMLTNNIQDLLDPQKKSLSYQNLNMQLVIQMLKKYSQAKSTGGKVRELKKKDVQALVKKLCAPVK